MSLLFLWQSKHVDVSEVYLSRTRIYSVYRTTWTWIQILNFPLLANVLERYLMCLFIHMHYMDEYKFTNWPHNHTVRVMKALRCLSLPCRFPCEHTHHSLLSPLSLGQMTFQLTYQIWSFFFHSWQLVLILTQMEITRIILKSSRFTPNGSCHLPVADAIEDFRAGVLKGMTRPWLSHEH